MNIEIDKADLVCLIAGLTVLIETDSFDRDDDYIHACNLLRKLRVELERSKS